jgi:eukaryotic-like serine/threonine-protein kinase
MLSTGSVFAGYRIERVLGAGGMGTVYLVGDPELPRSDALKVLSPELSRDNDFRARFVREADVAAALDHPNIVLVYRRGEFEGQLWIAMRFVDGSDADAALREGTMTPARAVHIIGEVGKALDYAHQRGVVHRDVKPANFMLSGPVGPDERVLLGDFGIARALGDVGLTATGSFVATMSYAAPEVLAGQPFDHRADLYSLGCTLFRLLTGEPPFPAGNGGPGAVVAAHLAAPPPRVTQRTAGLSARMDDVIARALAKDPAHRFACARDLAAAAADALSDGTMPTTALWQPVPSARVSPYLPPTVHSGPQPSPAFGAPPPAMGAPPPPGFYPPHGFRPAPPPKRRWGRRIAAILAVLALAAGAGVAAVYWKGRSQPPRPAPSPTASPSPGAVPASAIPQLLLPHDQVAAIMGVTDVTLEKSIDTLSRDPVDFAQPDCLGAWQPGLASSYAGSTPTGSTIQVLNNQDSQLVSVIQAIVTVPDANTAHRFVTDQADKWAGCAGKTITENPTQAGAKETIHWTFGTLNNSGGTVSLTHFAQEHQMVVCQHAVTARSNVVVDVVACQLGLDNQGVDILNAIAARIPR